MDESIYRTDRRMDEDPMLNPENWLQKVRAEKQAAKALKKDIISKFGKGNDAPLQYAAAVDMARKVKAQDTWTSE